MSAALSGVMLLYLWGSCIAYLVIIGDSFASIISLGTGACSAPSAIPVSFVCLSTEGRMTAHAQLQMHLHMFYRTVICS